MSAMKVKPNTFYKKNTIDLGVNVSPIFPDFSQSTETTFTLSDGSPKQNAFILSGTVASQPSYGAGEINGGLLRLYSSEVDVNENRTMPELVGYSLDKTINIAEGGWSFAINNDVGPEPDRTVGPLTSIYNSKPFSDTPQLAEDFEGLTDGALLSINRMGGNSVVQYSNPYITSETLRMLLKRDGHQNGPKRMKNMEEMCGRRVEQPAQYKRVGEGTDYEHTMKIESWTFEDEYDIEWVNGNTNTFKFKEFRMKLFDMNRFDAVAHRYATEEHNINIAHVKFREITTATASPEGDPQANTGNTILSDFYCTRNFSNPFDTTTDDPMIISDITLTTENALNGGNSLRIYHNWGWASGNANQILQNQLDVSGNINPQCARVSLYDIPFPVIAQDVGASTFQNGDDSYGDARSVLPEIRMSMNVSKLAPNIGINISGAADNAVNAVTPVFGMASQALSNPPSNFSDRENTFLRSVTVTFSNYKPKAEHTTLDKFLDYGLSNYYGDTTSLTDNIVGGFTITRYGINGKSGTNQTSQNMFAYPLPVMKMHQLNNGGGAVDREDYTMAKSGMARMYTGSAVGEQSGMLANPDFMVWGEPDATTVENDQIRYCELPMNSWITMRAFTDVFAYNNSGSCLKSIYDSPDATKNPTAPIAKRGVPMRVIFDTGMPNEQVVVAGGASLEPALVSGGSRVAEQTRNLPFLDIFFPAGTNDISEYTWYDYPELYPRHMTVWVQNYCWVSGSDDSNASIWRYNDYKILPSGAAREAEVFIDNIQLYNFEPDIKNVAMNDALVFEPHSHYSPVGLTTSGSIYGHGWVDAGPQTLTGSVKVTAGSPDAILIDGQTFDMTWLDNHGVCNLAGGSANKLGTGDVNRLLNIDGRLAFEMTGNAGATEVIDDVVFTMSTGSLQPPSNRANLLPYDGGQNVCLGLDDKGDLPTWNGTSGYTGYFLANDFSSTAWNNVTGNVLLPRKAVGQPANASGAIFSRGYLAVDMPSEYATIMGGNLFINGPGHYTVGGTDVNNVSGAAFDVTNATTVGGDEINLGGGSTNDFFSCDGFRQRGFFAFNISGSGTVTSGSSRAKLSWERRENALTSTKIIGMADIIQTNNYQGLPSQAVTKFSTLNANQIRVRNPRVFNFNNPYERYIIYLMGGKSTAPTTDIGTLEFRKGNLKLAGPPEGDIITFTQDIYKASDGSTPLMIEQNFHRLYVSPYKYWVSMLFDSDENNTQRSYEGFCGIQEIPSQSANPSYVSGSTYAESSYSYDFSNVALGGQSSQYKNEWDLIPSENNATLLTSIDTGYGALDPDTGKGGYVVYGSMIPNNYNIYPFTPITTTYEPGDGAPMVLYMLPGATEPRTATFYSDDYTTDTSKVPTMFWSFLDTPPIVNNLTSQPASNVVNGDTNLYDITTQNLNAIRFNWEEENCEDVWYRYIIVSDKPINDKYHGCIMRLPLDESVSNFGTAPALTVYNPEENVSTAADVGTDVRQVLEGQGGYASVLGGSTANSKITVTSAANYRGLEDLDEFSLVIHWTPAASDAGNKRYIVTQMDPTAYPGPSADAFIAYKDTDDTITITMGTDVSLTSTASVICDGLTPTNIIMTYNSGSSAPNKANLYIDGTWQDGSTGQTRVQGDEDFIVGGYYAVGQSGSAGMFEEILIYNNELHVIDTANEYTMSTAGIDDFYDANLNTSLNKENITHTARLFAADYHNFRGYNIQTQAMTNPTSWGTTTV
tara:strand:+ start:1290 stop:6449 length:5160 start_codon:yes stop_codon:yes gene_type:complete